MKRLLSLVLAMSMIMGICASCTQNQEEVVTTLGNYENVEWMTRAQWITLLGQTFGMDSYTSPTPHFSDVTASDEAYPYVQSCYEWELLVYESDQFKPEESADKKFVAITAVLATGILPSDDQDALLAMALDESIVNFENNDWAEALSVPEGQAAVAIAQHLYLNHEQEEVIEYNYTEAGKSLTYLAPNQMRGLDGIVDDGLNEDVEVPTEEDTMVVIKEVAEDWEIGTIFISPPTANYPAGVACKVTSIEWSGDEAFVQTTTPELGEIYEELNVHTTVQADMSNAILADGVSMSGGMNTLGTQIPLDETTSPDLLRTLGFTSYDETPLETTALSSSGFSFDINLSSGQANINAGWDDFKVTASSLIPPILPSQATGVTLPDNGMSDEFEKTNFIRRVPFDYGDLLDTDENGWEESLLIENKYSGGYEISGTIAVPSLTVTPTIEYSWFTLKKLAVEISTNITSSLILKGNLANEISIATLPIPVAAVPGLVVEVEFVLYVTASGELEVKLVVGNSTKMEYSNGSLRRTSSNSATPSGTLSVKVEAGAALGVLVSMVGIDIVDVRLKAGALYQANGSVTCVKEVILEPDISADIINKTSTYTLSAALIVDVAAPIVTLEVGSKKTLANDLKISASWTLVSADSAPYKKELFRKETPFFLLSITEEYDGEEIPEALENDEDFNPYAGLVLEKAFISLDNNVTEQLQIISYPSGEGLEDLSFTSKNQTVASVSDSGVVTALSEGTALIYVTSPSGWLQVCAISVGGGRVFTPADFL